MPVFAAHIESGKEERIVQDINRLLGSSLEAFCPLRELVVRKKGKEQKKDVPLFSGYLFINSVDFNPEKLGLIRRISGFYRVLPSNRDVQPLPPADIEVIQSLFNKHYKAPMSKAYFDENQRIRIIEGPLKGKEGLIVKVDKRKGRAKIKVNAFNSEHFIDLGFWTIQSAEKMQVRI